MKLLEFRVVSPHLYTSRHCANLEILELPPQPILSLICFLLARADKIRVRVNFIYFTMSRSVINLATPRRKWESWFYEFPQILDFSFKLKNSNFLTPRIFTYPKSKRDVNDKRKNASIERTFNLPLKFSLLSKKFRIFLEENHFAQPTPCLANFHFLIAMKSQLWIGFRYFHRWIFFLIFFKMNSTVRRIWRLIWQLFESISRINLKSDIIYLIIIHNIIV